MAEKGMADNKTQLKELLASLATVPGDLSNITAPPFVLDSKSAVELPAYWAERPSVFVAPAAETDPAKRALLVLRWFVSSLRNQQYAGRNPKEGVKKPLNAFLGEVFLAKWEDGAGTTRIISEQVLHHPPVTACRVWNDKHGVSAEGFTRQSITFSGYVNVSQVGYALLRIAAYDETYLIPLPNVKVKGITSGEPYPELDGKYYIPCTNGFTCCVEFSGKSFFGGSGEKNSFTAELYKHGDKSNPIYTVDGSWVGGFVVKDTKTGETIETFQHDENEVTPMVVDPIEEQDPWETRRAWKGVSEALETRNMQAVADAKGKLEKGQRAMRKEEGDDDGKNWKRLFFNVEERDEVADTLWNMLGEKFNPEKTHGIWKFDQQRWKDGVKKPFRGNTAPDNTPISKDDKMRKFGSLVGGQEEYDNDRRESDVGIRPEGVLSLGEAGQRQPRHFEPETDPDKVSETDRQKPIPPSMHRQATMDRQPPAAVEVQQDSPVRPDTTRAEEEKPKGISKLFSAAKGVFKRKSSPSPTREKKGTEGLTRDSTTTIPPTTTNMDAVTRTAGTTPSTQPKFELIPAKPASTEQSGRSPSTQIETEAKADPPLPEAQQQKERDEVAQLESGIEGMTVDEKDNIEDMLRNMNSTRGRAR